ncbi:toxin-antitoxin system YwqK family antitoxin [Yeosuana sp. MJ-SS3]|uniref:Toxin-antitoxin system YwqK family antitoxin n=1 Tax=Gilvirhabdus luticola TaxID=3079858 RepID=A0ABU3U9G1_9FLAO|nr:toxin-antitoxin system YwqK family antitoxin [Yeosuana sp. MJ-SS3]MDU8886992.1 toxin-antitoxin system YwqK family antitoxin [Yeosuana sp. MJ-SS3]
MNRGSVIMSSVGHAEKFGNLVIQDSDGRMKTVNSFSSDLLIKLSNYDHYEEFNSNQVFLSMMESPRFWDHVPIIYLNPKTADTIRKLIGVDLKESHVAFANFFAADGKYKLAPYLVEAFREETPTEIQKEIIEANRRMELLWHALAGRMLKLFPVSESELQVWISPKEYVERRLEFKDAMYGKLVKNGFKSYINNLRYYSKKNGDYSQANQLLDSIKKAQKTYCPEFGPWKVYFENGQLKEEEMYYWPNQYEEYQALRVDKKEWYENGQLKAEATWEDGKMEGLKKSWYENGQLWIEKTYKEGKEDGVLKLWHDNGHLQDEGTYRDGKEEGVWKNYDEEGKLIKETTYEDGKIVSEKNY